AEVRFRDGGAVRGLIVGALRERLAIDGIRATSTGGLRTIDRLAARMPAAAGGWDWRRSPAAPAGGLAENGAGSGEADFTQPGLSYDAAPAARMAETEASPDAALHHMLGAARAQLHETYIVAQTGDGIVIVDQHAAHERLVYERLKRQRAENAIARQMLLIPAVVELDEASVARLVEAAPLLAPLGLALEGFGPGAVAVSEVPAAVGGDDVIALVRDLADSLEEWGGPL